MFDLRKLVEICEAKEKNIVRHFPLLLAIIMMSSNNIDIQNRLFKAFFNNQIHPLPHVILPDRTLKE